jgi:hypothetical protein
MWFFGLIVAGLSRRPGRAVSQAPIPGEEIIYILEGSVEYQVGANRQGCAMPVKP